MKVCGIVAEYNPFHNGHAYQIRQAREVLGADFVIIIMSGDFVQRGAPAIVEKHHRARMALEGGADLVLELPVFHAVSSAEGFAHGAVEILDSLGVVDFLCFGAETPSISDMMAVADILTREPDEFRAKLKELQKSGVSFPGARAEAVLSYLKTAGAFAERETDPSRLLSDIGGLLSSPNNILGIEYCKALIRLHSSIKPVPIRRMGGGYFSPASREDDPKQDSPSPSLLSAFAIRDEIRRVSSSTCTGGNMEGLRRFLLRCMPEEAALLLFRLVQENAVLFEDSLDLLLGYRLLQETLESLRSYADISEPVARRILHFRNQYSGFLSFTELLKTRDVAQTRISRCLCHLVLELTDTGVSPTYARVLGFRKESASLLSAIKEGSRLPLVTKASEVSRVLDAAGTAQYAKGVWASDVYQLLLSRKSRTPFFQEHQKKVVLL